MPDDIFRYFIAGAVGLALIAFVVQAGFVIALYRAVRKMQAKVEPLVERADPLIEKAGPAFDQAAAVMAKAAPVMEKLDPVMVKAGVAIERLQKLTETTNGILEDSRPRIAAISEEAVQIARTSREQVERMGDLLHDAGERARERLVQIDESVSNTVGQVENASDALRNAVMKPVREVNGLAAGVSAAISTLVRGRKSSVDSATQDEEMFI